MIGYSGITKHHYVPYEDLNPNVAYKTEDINTLHNSYYIVCFTNHIHPDSVLFLLLLIFKIYLF